MLLRHYCSNVSTSKYINSKFTMVYTKTILCFSSKSLHNHVKEWEKCAVWPKIKPLDPGYTILLLSDWAILLLTHFLPKLENSCKTWHFIYALPLLLSCITLILFYLYIFLVLNHYILFVHLLTCVFTFKSFFHSY
jgi:hypothetical protein